MSDWEHGIVLHPMQGIQASSPTEGDVSWDFLIWGRNLGYILELQQGLPLESPLVQRGQDSCLVRMDISGI